MTANTISLKCLIAVAILLAVTSGCSKENSTEVTIPPVTGQWSATSAPNFVEYSYSSQYADSEQWVSGFGEVLLSHWVSPYAYRLGLISGHTFVRVVVSSSGEFVESAVEDSLGHASLHAASMAALDNMGSTATLPENLGSSNFEIQLTFTYPQVEQ